MTGLGAGPPPRTELAGDVARRPRLATAFVDLARHNRTLRHDTSWPAAKATNPTRLTPCSGVVNLLSGNTRCDSASRGGDRRARLSSRSQRAVGAVAGAEGCAGPSSVGARRPGRGQPWPRGLRPG